MWVEMLSWWCRLFGYATCGQASTFEAIILAVLALFASTMALGVLGLVLGGLSTRN
jgi:hypothetical protein